MWTAFATLALSLLKWIFGGHQQSEGEAQGQAEQENAALTQELSNVQKAENAARAVDPDGVSGDPNNRDSDNYKGR